ncbi:MAG: hypothetical protein ABI208_06650, partial [Ginsengibacter sp.]
MKRNSLNLSATLLVVASVFTFALASCTKSGDVQLPPIGGYNNSDEVASANLMAYWNFDGNQNEIKSGTAATSSSRVSYVPGVKGQAIKLDSGFVFYNSIPAINAMTTFSVSAWVQTRNNGSTNQNFTSMVFQASKPGSTFGNLNLGLETSWKPANNDTLVVHGWYSDPSNGLQDNRNDPFGVPPVGVVLNPVNKWVFLTMTADNANPVNFNIYANGVNVGAYSQRGTAVYTPQSPSSVIIGAWMNNIP